MTLPTLLLGTAQWGWKVDRDAAFRLLDAWLRAGHWGIDTATNYPINRQPTDFRAAEKILEEYVRAHGLRDLQITMKVGSLDNMRSPEANLAPSFLLMMAEEYHRRFGDNLHGVMLHWDNRTDETAIHASLEALALLQKQYGLRPGLSGIAHPEVYAQANADLGLSFDIQLKNNVFHSDLSRYQPLLTPPNPPAQVFAYGINAGGVKLEGSYPADSTFLARGGQPEQMAARLEQIRALLPGFHQAFVRPPVKTMNHLGLIYAALHPQINGVVLGLSSEAQLAETLDFWRNLDVFDYGDVWEGMRR